MRVEERTEIVKRLRSAEGHLNAITGMVEDGKTCEQVLHQLHAVQAAVQAASCLILIKQVERCLDALQQNPGHDEISKEINRLVDLYKFELTLYSLDARRKIREVKP